MTKVHNKNTFKNTYPHNSVKTQSIAEVQKPNKFQLMSKAEYQQIKTDLFDVLIPSQDFNIGIGDYIKNKLQIPLNDRKNPNEIALLSDFYLKNPKLSKICEIEMFSKHMFKYIQKTRQYNSRLEILEKTHHLLPEIVSENAINIIKEYVSLGFNTTYSLTSLQTSLDNISVDLLDQFMLSVEEYKKTKDKIIIFQPKYQLFHDFDKLLGSFNTLLISEFKKAYLIYKKCLTLILETNYALTGNSILYYNHQLLLLSAHINMPVQPLDNHIFIQLLRLQIFGPSPNEMHPFPIVSTEQNYQLRTYFEEITHIIFINIILSEKYKISNNIFTCLPLSLTINKKPKDFFGKAISKNTYSILLEYLGNVNKALIGKTLDNFIDIKNDKHKDK